jgi:hypothetical protein
VELKDDGNESCSAYELGPLNVERSVAGTEWAEGGRVMMRATAYMGVLFCLGWNRFFLAFMSSTLCGNG